jgi:hypothetical protein
VKLYKNELVWDCENIRRLNKRRGYGVPVK